jgi:hypothetical protein
MTIDDLFLEHQLNKMNKLDSAWARFQSEAQDMQNGRRSIRRGIASLFVRFGVWLDRGAGERIVVRPRFQAPKQQEGHHVSTW